MGLTQVRESRSAAWRAVWKTDAGGNVLGTYLHGLFDSGVLTDRLAAGSAGKDRPRLRRSGCTGTIRRASTTCWRRAAKP
ncbi:MAG: hypothetical protein ACLTYN_03940 [Dysosmobacter welbionis]